MNVSFITEGVANRTKDKPWQGKSQGRLFQTIMPREGWEVCSLHYGFLRMIFHTSTTQQGRARRGQRVFMVVTRSWEQTTKREQSKAQVRGSG